MGANGDIERKGSLIHRRVVTPSPLRRMAAAACRDRTNRSILKPAPKHGKCLPAAGTPTPRGQGGGLAAAPGGGGVDARWRCQQGGALAQHLLPFDKICFPDFGIC